MSIVKTIGSKTKEIARVSTGDCVGEIAFTKDTKRTASAIAIEHSTIMALEEKGLSALPAQIRSVIYKNMIELAAQRIDNMGAHLKEVSDRNKYLTLYFRDILKTHNERYGDSEMIQNILKSFPRMPIYTTRLTAMLFDETISINDVIEFAKTDPSLVSVVLKAANSPYYNLPGKVGDFQHAILLLGFHQIYQIVIDNGIMNIMPGTPEFHKLRLHCILIAVLCFEIALICNMNRPLTMNTLGLLHDIGKSIVLLLKKDYHNLSVLLDMLDDAKIGSLLLKEWNLPDAICMSMEYQRFPEFAPPEEILPEYQKAVAVLHVAHQCCEYLTGKDQNKQPSEFLKEYMQVLTLPMTISELADNHIVPSLHKKANSLPEDIRNMLLKK